MAIGARLRQLGPSQRLAALRASLPFASGRLKDALALEIAELVVSERGWAAWDATSWDPVAIVARVFGRSRAERAAIAMEILVRNWGGFSPETKALVLAVGEGEWEGVVRRAAALGNATDRVGVARFIRDLGDASLVGVLADLLVVEHAPPAREVVERCLVGFCAAAARRKERRPDSRAGVEGGVVRALETWAVHRRRGVLLGALLLLDLPALSGGRGMARSPLVAWFEEGEGPSHVSLRSLLRRSRDPMTRVRALEWVWREKYSAACLDRLSQPGRAEEDVVIAARGHLTIRPARARRVRMLRVRSGAMPAPERVPEARQRLGLVRLARALGGPAGAREDALRVLASDPSPRVRHAAVRAIGSTDLAAACEDADGRVASAAFLRWSALGSGREIRSPALAQARHGVLERLRQSGHGRVRAWAEEETAGEFEPAQARSRLVARWGLRDDREGTLARVRAGLGSGDLRFPRLARLLMISAELERELVAGSGHPDPRFASACVSALGDVDTSSARQALERCVRHEDGRVASNAMEALHRFVRRTGQARSAVSIEFKDDSRHRVRATLLRVLALDGEDGVVVEALGSMLRDERGGHRLAGAWLAERLACPAAPPAYVARWNELATRVGELARSDADERVRRRAARCGRRMLSHVRWVWSQREGAAA